MINPVAFTGTTLSALMCLRYHAAIAAQISCAAIALLKGDRGEGPNN